MTAAAAAIDECGSVSTLRTSYPSRQSQPIRCRHSIYGKSAKRVARGRYGAHARIYDANGRFSNVVHVQAVISVGAKIGRHRTTEKGPKIRPSWRLPGMSDLS